VRSGWANFPAKSYILSEPLGVCCIIGAWNYPIQLTLVPAINALAAGNTVVLKPSELSSNVSRVLKEIINAHFEENYFHVVEGGIEETNQLLENRFDKLFFTGSVAVGKIIYEKAAKHLTPVTLELGGKSPCFVLEDCAIQLSVKRIVWSKFLNAGQTCIAPDYILVDEKIKIQFLEVLVKEIDQFYSNWEQIPENYVQIINEKHLLRLEQLIDPKKVYYGGKIIREKRLISPTILDKVNWEDLVMEDEIFGPILPVLTYTDLSKAIKEVNSKPKPLACYIYSKNKQQIQRILNEVSFGGGCVNDSVMHISNSNLPFGGVGTSGMGNYHGKFGFDTFSHKKSILSKSLLFETTLKYAPYSERKLKLIRLLLGR
jgi:aldehyde dehydrogenase (NAD+)